MRWMPRMPKALCTVTSSLRIFFVTKCEHTKILDFGLAKLTLAGGQSVGTTVNAREMTEGVSEEHLYVRAEASRAAKNGRQAAAEYQKILDHRGVVLYEPIGALAHLGLARAYALQGETAKARVAYQNFLSSWKDADPDIPILIAAESEYAKLK
jgi:outer membrane protein assembly factor BamD (BamD/ComL family)